MLTVIGIPLVGSNSRTRNGRLASGCSLCMGVSWHTLHLSRTRGPEILYTLPRVVRGGGMPLVAVALLTLQGGAVNNGQHRRGGHTFARFMTLLTLLAMS